MSLDELKLKIKDYPITAIIGHYLSLSKRGNSTLAICPFHQDSRPSLNINDKLGIYKCFSCDASGDHISFVQRYRNLGFLEALNEVSKFLGLNFDDYYRPSTKSPKEEMGRKILSRANKIFQTTANQGSEPFNQFIKTRNLNDEMVKTFGLGMAPHTNVVLNYLNSIPDENQRQLALQSAQEIGVIKKSHKTDSLYDTFRDRIIFPIWDQFGQIVGFGGRALSQDQYAKYLNSSDSILFNKKNILYGLNIAKPHIRQKDRLILVEGYMDVIALHRHHFNDAIGVMGVALGPGPLLTIKALTQNIFIGTDSDQAGKHAMKRMNAQFMGQSLLPKYLDFSPYKDPDEFLVAQGPLALQERIDNAKFCLDILIEEEIPDTPPQETQELLHILERIFVLLSPLGQGLLATEKAITAAKRLNISSGSDEVVAHYKNFISKNSDSKFSVQSKITSKALLLSTSPILKENEVLAPYTQHQEVEHLHESFEDKQKTEWNRASKMFVSEIASHPELLEHVNFDSLLDFVEENEVKRYILELKNFVFEIDETEYPQLVTGFAQKQGFPLELREAIANGLYKYTGRQLNDKNIRKLLVDIEMKYKEYKLFDQKKGIMETIQQTSEFQRPLLLQDLFQIEKQIQELRANKSQPKL